MAREEAIEYFKTHRKIFCEDFLKTIPKNTISYQATLKEKEFYDMAIKSLETMEEFERAQILVGGRLNGRTYAYKRGLEDGKRKKGKWIDSVYSLGFTCTCCLTTQTSGCRYKFCPNCGAEMESEDGI